MRWEIEFSTDGGETWAKIGFMTIGGFNPYRYEFKEDAEWTAHLLHPKDLTRAIPSKTAECYCRSCASQ